MCSSRSSRSRRRSPASSPSSPRGGRGFRSSWDLNPAALFTFSRRSRPDAGPDRWRVWIYYLGCAIALVRPWTNAAPTRGAIERDHAVLTARGSQLSLVAALRAGSTLRD